MGKHREGIGVTSLAFFSKTSTTKRQWQWHWNAMNWGNKIFFNERSLICTDFILLQVFLFLQGISLHWNAMVCGNKITLNEKSKIVKIFFLTDLSFSIVLFESLTPLKNTVKKKKHLKNCHWCLITIQIQWIYYFCFIISFK